MGRFLTAGRDGQKRQQCGMPESILSLLLSLTHLAILNLHQSMSCTPPDSWTIETLN